METERICPNCQKPLPPDVPLGLCPECLIKSGFPTEAGAGAGGATGGFVPPTVEEITKLFPQFEIISLIGKGGMGAVYKARQPGLDRFVALKVLPPAVANDPGFAERFNREARALARLSHPNIVTVYDFGVVGQAGKMPAPLHYLLMEFVDGTNLREVERAGRLSPEQALAIVPQICEALQFAHNEGIVHRDIKPENLLLDKKGRVKITDFGIAKILGVTEGKASLTGVRDVVGTPHYMAPEQIERPQTVDHRADIYSLGVVFYEMLTGELPLGKFAPPSKKVQVDVRLDEVVLHTLEKEPERRYQHASQVKTDVETIATSAPPPAIGPAATPGTTPTAPAVPLQPAVSDRVILPAFLLAFFFGIFGAHRFYAGKIRSGLLQLAGLGGCVVLVIVCATDWRAQPTTGILLATLICGCAAWTMIDWILILCKVFTDGNGRRIVNWWHPGPNAVKPSMPPNSPVPPKGDAAMPGGMNRPMIIAPAIALIIAGCLKLLGALTGLLYLLFNWRISHEHPYFFIPGFIHFMPPLAASAALLFSVIPALVIILGGVEMLRLRSYAWAMAASIVAIFFCSLMGTPVGIWAMIVLLLTSVRETFAKQSAPSDTSYRLLILGTVAMACLLLFLMISFGDLFNLLMHHHRVAARSPFPSMATATPAQPIPPTPPTAPMPPLLPTPPPPPMPAPSTQDMRLIQMLERRAVAEVNATRPTKPMPPTLSPPELMFRQALAGLTNTQAQFSSLPYPPSYLPFLLAELTNTEAQYKAGRVPAVQVQVVREMVEHAREEIAQMDKTMLEEAQSKLRLKWQLYTNYKNGQISAADFQQEAGAEAALRATYARMTTNGPAPLNYQWYSIPANITTASSAVITNNAGYSFVSVPVYEKVDVADSRDFSKSFAVAPNGSLTMDVDRGDVQITGGDEGTVEIHVERDVRGANDPDASEILQEEQVVLEHNGNQVSITAQNPPALRSNSLWGWWNRPNLDVHYEITVPRDFTVQSRTSGGSVKVVGVQGEVKITTMGGELDCTDIGGDVEGKTMGGSVRVRGCRGGLKLQTMGGNITVDEFSGPDVQATTSGGSVSADFATAPTADCELHTMGGNVTVRLPDNAAVTLDGRTMGGAVRTDFSVQTKESFGNNTLNGPINGGGPTLKMDTEGGNVEVWKR